MGNQQTIEQQVRAAELKALKIGAVVFVLFLCLSNFFVAIFISGYFTVLLGLFLKLKAGLPISCHRKRGNHFEADLPNFKSQFFSVIA